MKTRTVDIVVSLVPFGLIAAFALILFTAPAFAQQSVVAKYRGLYPTPMTQDQLLALERAVAADVHGGLLKKPDGNSCGGYACDIICRSDSELFDILGDAEGAGAPQWNPTTNPRGYHCELVAPAPPSPPPPAAPNLEARVTALEQRLAAWEATAGTSVPPPPAPVSDLAADVKRIRTLLELVAKRFGLQP